jgi:hypothetical protein
MIVATTGKYFINHLIFFIIGMGLKAFFKVCYFIGNFRVIVIRINNFLINVNENVLKGINYVD